MGPAHPKSYFDEKWYNLDTILKWMVSLGSKGKLYNLLDLVLEGQDCLIFQVLQTLDLQYLFLKSTLRSIVEIKD